MASNCGMGKVGRDMRTVSHERRSGICRRETADKIMGKGGSEAVHNRNRHQRNADAWK